MYDDFLGNSRQHTCCIAAKNGTTYWGAQKEYEVAKSTSERIDVRKRLLAQYCDLQSGGDE